MKQYERSKRILLEEVTNAVEMATYMEALRLAAVVYCEQEYPDEVIYNDKTDRDITHSGWVNFLNREV